MYHYVILRFTRLIVAIPQSDRASAAVNARHCSEVISMRKAAGKPAANYAVVRSYHTPLQASAFTRIATI